MIERIRRHSRSGVALVLAILGSVAQAQAVTDFDLPAQSLGEALRAIAGQTNSNILFDRNMVAGRSVKALKTQATIEEALQQVLTGTGLTFKHLDDKTVTIVPVGASTSSYRATSTSTATLGLAAQSAAAQEATRNDNRLILEEIIVTAQKRKEPLQEVPQSVTVVGGATLERLQAHDFQDYVGLIPGLSLQSSTPGVSRLTLRGINTDGAASTVAVYVDEVPYGSSSGLADGGLLAGDFDTLDIERLEVLRGPQGTLYGASALGGVLKVVTKEPRTDAFSASASTSVENVAGGDPSYAGTAVVNIPFGERFAARASGFYRSYGGFIDSVSGPVFELGGPAVILDARRSDNINEAKIYGGRVSGLFKASDTLSVRLTALLQNIVSDSSNAVEADPATLEPLNGRPTFSQYHPESTEIKYRVYSATLDWDLGFADLVSSSSYATFDDDFVNDFTFQFAPVLTAIFGNPLTRPLSAVRRQSTSTDKTTQELRLASPDDDSFEWLIGAFFTREKSLIGPQAINTTEGITDTLAADVPLLSDARLPASYEEYAGFANATWHFTPRFDVTFGGRWSRNEQEADLFITGLINGPGLVIDDSRSAENVFTYSVAPRFDLSDDASIYARVATGYRPGGPNVIPPDSPPGTPFTYDADRTTNYEVGLKSDWLDSALTLDVAAYYIAWDDIQLVAVINGTGVNDNGGTAVSKGVEFAAAARPVPGLTLALNGAYTDAYLTEDTDPIVGGFDGDSLPYVPDWSLSLSGDYEWTVFGDSTAYIGSSVRHVDRQNANFRTRTPTGGLQQIPTYEIFDVRAGLRTRRWSLEAYAKNIGDKGAITSLFGQGFLPNGAVPAGIVRPRTIGLSLGMQF